MSRVTLGNLSGYVLSPISSYIKDFGTDFFMGMHSHGYIEIMYAHKGSFEIEIYSGDDENNVSFHTVHESEFVLIDAFVYHRLRIHEPHVTIYNVEFLPTRVDGYNPYDVFSHMPINFAKLVNQTALAGIARAKDGFAILPDTAKVNTYFRSFINQLSKSCKSLEDAVSLHCKMLLFLMEVAKCASKPVEGNISYIKKIFNYIRRNINKKITLDQIASEVGMHKVYLATQFKRHTGKTILETVNLLRISKAVQLLRESNLSVNEIAGLVGFSSYAQFIYEFKKHTGKTPREYREFCLTNLVNNDYINYESHSIRIDNEDFLLDDDTFYQSGPALPPETPPPTTFED